MGSDGTLYRGGKRIGFIIEDGAPYELTGFSVLEFITGIKFGTLNRPPDYYGLRTGMSYYKKEYMITGANFDALK